MEYEEHWTGSVGEAGFAWKSARLRLSLSKPVGDKEAYDYIVDRGRRFLQLLLRRLLLVQIKTTATLVSKNSYHVNCGKGAGQKTPYAKGEIDFLVVYVVPEDSWFILPWEALGGRLTLSIPSKRRKNMGRLKQYHENWELLTGEAEVTEVVAAEQAPPACEAGAGLASGTTSELASGLTCESGPGRIGPGSLRCRPGFREGCRGLG